MTPRNIVRHWQEAAYDPRSRSHGEGGADSGPEHRAYLNEVLGDYFCHADGEPWPCLHDRQRTQCRCSHDRSVHEGGSGECWSTACGCMSMRLRGES